ncbi:MAG TPA: glycosyltransferase [Saprospiraceae bacterium]|nr:glycosyltransferase [Saprospiraceae bacterium]
MIAVSIALGFALPYLLLQAYYLFYWYKTKPASIPSDYLGSTSVTIVVVAHNESKSISSCLQGILQQAYPAHLMEIIVIDDHSTDTTIEEVQKIGSERIAFYNLKDYPEYIKAPAFKKSAITLAVDKATSEYIVITDADCVHPDQWLNAVVYGLEKNQSAFQTSPVVLDGNNTLLSEMQEAEQLVLMLITAAGITSGLHDIANGANMAFRKSAFRKVDGFTGNEQFASGDDMFLAEKMRKAFPGQIAFNKSINASVSTQAKKNWPALIKQRLRWAGKNKGLESPTIARIWIFVGLYHFMLLLSLAASLFNLISPLPFIILFVVKWFADFLVITTAASFFRKTSVLKYFVPLQFLYSYYILRLGLAMMMGKRGDWTRVSPG